MYKLFTAVVLTSTLSLPAAAQVDVYGYGAVRAGSVESTDTWLNGWFGRFDQGASAPGDSEDFATGEVHIAVDWLPSDSVVVHLQGIARADDAADTAESAGFVEAYVRWQVVDGEADRFALAFGQKFLPTSFENTDDLWQSPYTLTYSAWNSWIANEFRPIGVETSYTHTFNSGNRLGLRANVFGGNDASGAQLAWSGWKFSNRLTVFGETLPLPPLATLVNTGDFFRQNDDGSKPFTTDLDDEPGFSAQVRFETQNLKLRQTWVDTQGDKKLWRNEYAWRTVFNISGFEWTATPSFTVLGEFATGSTRMGNAVRNVNVDLKTAYLLASYNVGNHRISARYDDFDLEDKDGQITDNGEDGSGWTVAYFFAPGSFRFGLEYSEVDVNRIAAQQSGFDPNHDAKQVSLEVRYVF